MKERVSSLRQERLEGRAVEKVRRVSKRRLAVPISGLCSILGTGCAETKLAAPPVGEARPGGVEEASGTAASWIVQPRSRGRWYREAIILPDQPDHWREVHGVVPTSDARTWWTEDAARDSLTGADRRGGEVWLTPSLDRPAILGRVRCPEEGAREILEIDAPEGRRIGSVALVAVESLSSDGRAGGAVVRLPHVDLGPSPFRPYTRRLVEVTGRSVPPGTYLLFVVTESGTPSSGQQVFLGGSIPSRAAE